MLQLLVCTKRDESDRVTLALAQVITTRLVNTRDNNLRKGYGYHLDLAIVAVYCGVASCFGLPWMTAATVRQTRHTPL
jgi:hypothetical protein